MNTVPDLYTIMFADVVGSTRLYERLGDARAKDCVVTTQGVLDGVVREYGGEVVEVIGDELMCRFDDPNAAVFAACAMHKAVSAQGPLHGQRMSIRIGLHHGSVIVEGERMFGDSVNTAARMATFAMQEQIITTEETVRRLSRDAEAMARKFDVIKVKGKRDGITVYSIHWREDASATMFESVPPQSVDTSTKLSLLYHGERIQVAPDTEIFSMGRSDECDLAVEGALVSRLHARFEFHRGKILLIDQSTNGTYVRTNDGGKFFLRREGLPVWGKGIIGLGAPIDEENPHTVEFEFA